MTQAAKAQEPSMEEILASIRRIIADDDAAKSPQRPADPIPPTPTSRPGAAVPPARPVAASPQPRNVPAAAPVGPTPKADEIDAVLNELNKEPGSDMAAPDVLELTEAMTAPPRGDGLRTGNDMSEERTAAAPREAAPAPERRLVSASTSAAVDSAFNALAQTVLVQNARTLEDLVREMLRPMLKGWLDDNLPGLVERLVRSEIERVSRGRS